MAPKENRGSEDDNVIRFDFRDELKKQRGKQRRKEWILGLGAFSIVFAGGMLALNWPTLGSTSLTSSELTPKFSLVDRKRVVWGKRVSVRVDLGGGGIIKKKKH